MRECDERMGGPGHGGCGGRKGGKGFRRLEEEVTSWEQKRLGLGERKNLKRKSDAKVPKAGGEGGCAQEKNFREENKVRADPWCTGIKAHAHVTGADAELKKITTLDTYLQQEGARLRNCTLT